MIPTSKYFIYADLDSVLQHIGCIRVETAEERVYRHPLDNTALIRYPMLPFSDPVREYHRVAARQIVDGFGIVEAADFDLILFEFAYHRRKSEITNK